MLRLDFEAISNRTMIEHFLRITFFVLVYGSQSVFGFGLKDHGEQTQKSSMPKYSGFDSALNMARALLEWNRTQTISKT